MRPSSAGSSRISKRLLPFLADAAISIATPLSGTAVLVAAVAVNDAAAAGVVVAEGCCAWMTPAPNAPLPDALAGVCPESAGTACP